MNKQKAKIKNWVIVCLDVNEGHYALMGKIVDHPRQDEFDDPKGQMTSLLVRIDFPERVAETLNTVYELVGPEVIYEH